MLHTIAILSAVWLFIDSFLGFMYLSGLRRTWTRKRQVVTAVIAWVIFIGACSWVGVKTSKANAIVDRRELLKLREIADSAYEANDYGTAIKLMSWAIRFEDDEESFYRLRARAYKRQGDYRSEIKDRIKVYELNPGRELNHLPIIEDFTLLRECHNGQAWILDHENSIKGSDEKTMFEFFSLVCNILEGKEFSSQETEFRTRVSQYPLTKHFVEKFWDWETLLTFVGQSSISEQRKAVIRDLIQFLRLTAR